MAQNNYLKLFIILIISFVVMYFVMFLNVYQLGDVYLSLTRFYMTLLMVTPMSIIMILGMKHMYQNKGQNRIIMLGSALLFFIVLILLRTQTPIEDKQYVRAMISHHSSAILTSRNANIKDPEVRQLADGIIMSQQREIIQMKDILARMK